MKKIIALILTLILVMSLAIVAFATEPSDGMGDHLINVTGSYVPGTTSSDTLFSVEIKWENMNFIYHAAKAGEWDAENHKYLEDTEAYWEGEGTITVTNSSNAKITATPKYAAAQGYGDATMTFTPGKLSIASAESGKAEVGTMTVKPEGFLPEMDESATIGAITVTIAQDTNVTAEEMEALITLADELYNKVNNTALEDTMGNTFDVFAVEKRTAPNTLTQYNINPEGEQANLNAKYASLLASYKAVLALMPE